MKVYVFVCVNVCVRRTCVCVLISSVFVLPKQCSHMQCVCVCVCPIESVKAPFGTRSLWEMSTLRVLCTEARRSAAGITGRSTCRWPSSDRSVVPIYAHACGLLPNSKQGTQNMAFPQNSSGHRSYKSQFLQKVQLQC